MHSLSRTSVTTLLKSHGIKTRLLRELRYTPEDIVDWDDREMIAFSTRSGNEGVLFVELDKLYVLPYTLMTGLTDSTSGRSKPITCDFCYTWQQGGKAGRITFVRRSDQHSFTFLCCGDLLCSLHVRGKTPESILSRTQLREDLTPEDRTLRLRSKLQAILAILDDKQ